MVKRLIAFCVILMAVSVSAQDAGNETENKSEETIKKPPLTDNIYREEVLEDFESTEFTEKHLKFRKIQRQEGAISVRNDYPAPTGESKKYLGVKVFGRSGDAFTVIPAKDLIINKRCREISMWVYGKKFSGTLYILIKDANDDTHKLRVGQLNYLGWRKLRVKIPAKVKQEDKYLSKKRTIQITQIVYNPGNSARRHPIWQYFYIDDISGVVREKYTDRQSDDW